MIDTCKNCKHFTLTEKFHGICNSDKFKKGYFIESVDYSHDGFNPDCQPDEVMVEYDEEWGFKVGIDFGCIHFKI